MDLNTGYDTTRITCNSESLVDILTTNRLDKLLNSGVLQVGISYHSVVYGCFKISVQKENSKLVESRCFKSYNEDLFRRELLSAFNMHDLGQLDDLNNLWE